MHYVASTAFCHENLFKNVNVFDGLSLLEHKKIALEN